MAAGQAGIECVGKAGQSARQAVATTVVVIRLRSWERTPYRWKNPGLKTRNRPFVTFREATDCKRNTPLVRGGFSPVNVQN